MLKHPSFNPAVWSLILLMAACEEKPPDDYIWEQMEVTATAYNSVPWQTDHDFNIAAWGDTLSPGMKAIAVSRDLERKGLTHNTPVVIEGMEGIFLVKDKMHFRWRNKIDIYMGVDISAAREWGRKKVTIKFPVKKDSLPAVP